jgi:hypothetical protein
VPAEAIAEDDKEYMVFFYHDSAAFERERTVMAEPEYRELTVALRDAYPAENGEALTANGQCLPPAVVREDGETLRDWALGANSDPVLLVNTLVQVAEVLERLHAAGLVHRDIRPESLVWLPGQLAWCLVNFGFSAKHRAHFVQFADADFVALRECFHWLSSSPCVSPPYHYLMSGNCASTFPRVAPWPALVVPRQSWILSEARAGQSIMHDWDTAFTALHNHCFTSSSPQRGVFTVIDTAWWLL